ncbi:MAG TPA: AAA family ATPase [Phototrophicaceae bacterium]|nr:AAA family ATPase [Phototrophicaceae bacterium]
MTYSIAFHSYKGGTGKTTIASNLSAFLAKEGYSVCLLDLDIYAPSLQTYFEITPKKWINDYLYGDAKFNDVITDVSSLIFKKKEDGDKSLSKGKLFVGLCASRKEDFIKLEGGNSDFRKQLFHKLIMFREKLIETYDPDFIIIDTSPGVRYWSLNALALADVFFLTLKMGDIDIEGTKKMVNEIYHSFTTYGSKSFLIWNKVAGYCMPNTNKRKIVGNNRLELNSVNSISRTNKKDVSLSLLSEGNKKLQQQQQQQELQELQAEDQKREQIDTEDKLSEEVGMKVISTIPCYCDIQFSKKEFLTAVQILHPFSERIESLATLMQQELQDKDSE